MVLYVLTTSLNNVELTQMCVLCHVLALCLAVCF
jgi:hypothetical protein